MIGKHLESCPVACYDKHVYSWSASGDCAVMGGNNARTDVNVGCNHADCEMTLPYFHIVRAVAASFGASCDIPCIKSDFLYIQILRVDMIFGKIHIVLHFELSVDFVSYR